MTKGIIFDYGGTLDTGGNHWFYVFQEAYAEAGVAVDEPLLRLAYVTAERTLGKTPIIKPSFTFHETLRTKVQLQLEALSTQQGMESILEKDICDRITSFAYDRAKSETAKSRRVIQQLATQYPLVLVSNFYGNIATVLREFGFDGLFQKIIESAVVGIRKPDPRIFELGVKALGLKADEVVVVGDSLDKDIIPARKAGCKAIWLRGRGWEESNPTGKPSGTEASGASTEAANIVINDIEELTKTLAKL